MERGRKRRGRKGGEGERKKRRERMMWRERRGGTRRGRQ